MNEPAKIEKVTDDALSRSIISSVIGIIICMVCLVGTTWAWYSLSVESGENETFGANFDFDVAVTKNPTETTDQPAELVLPQDGQYSLDGGTYTVKLTKKPETSTETENYSSNKGFCRAIVKAIDCQEGTPYYVRVDFSGDKSAVTFKVTGPCVLNITPMLGTPTDSYTEILDGGIIPPLATLTAPLLTEKIPEEKITPAEDVTPTDGETGTPDETAEKQQQETPPAEEQQQQPVETPADPGTTEPEEKSEEVIGEQSQTKPETQVEPPVNTETTEPVTVPETQTEQTETSKTTTQE